MIEESLPPARVLIADDHALTRALLRTLLTSQPDLRLVGEAHNGEEAIELCRELHPDLVLMDLSMPGMNGIEATRSIKTEFPKISVLVLTAHADLGMLMDTVKAGAAGYILKGEYPDHVLGAVKAVLKGETPLDQGLAMRLLRSLAEEAGMRTAGSQAGPTTSEPAASLPNPLTPRETEVLGHLAAGQTNRQIAQDLHISLSTTKRHLERIISKLEVSDRTQAAVKAVEMGLLPAAPG